MAIGQLTVNVAANTPRANKALQALASGVRIVGREGRESGPGLKVITTGLKAIAAPGAAWAAGKGLTFVGKSLEGMSSTRAKAGGGSLLKTAATLAKIASIVLPGGALLKLLAAGTLVVGVAKTNHELTEVVTRLDSIGKRATRIGIGVEALDGLRHAATLTGVETRTLDVALEKMNIRIAEAAKGGGEAVKVLAEMGLNAERLNQLPTEEKFKAIADSLGGYTNKADKLRIAAKLFEEEGTALVNTMALGSEGIQKLIDDANALGSPTKAMTDSAAAFADASARADKTWGHLADKIATATIDLKTLALEVKAILGGAANQAWDASTRAPWNDLPLHERRNPNATPNKVWSLGPMPWNEGSLSDRLGPRAEAPIAGALTAAEQAAADARVAASVKQQRQADLVERRRYQSRFRDRARRQRKWLTSQEGAVGQWLNDSGLGFVQQALSQGAGAVDSFQRFVGDAKFRTDAFMRERGKLAAQGLNPLTGLRPIDRERLAPRSINSLIEADSVEGYLALRANRRGGEQAKHVAKTADNTSRTAVATEATATAVRSVVEAIRAIPLRSFG